MGQTFSNWWWSDVDSQIDDDDMLAWEQMTGFTPNQIRRLYRRFTQLDTANRGYIVAEDLMAIPELAINPISNRIIQLFVHDAGTNPSRSIEFPKFLTTLAVFAPLTQAHKRFHDTNEIKQWEARQKHDKLQFLFNIYDTHGDGFIDQQELFSVLKGLVVGGMSDEQLRFIVEQTICEADNVGDGNISFDKFCHVLESSDVFERMSIRI
eukprot:m.136545 g.136545  ORF g.136545 m.136545 type:complete len:209 (+) comp10733_c0_seq1:89-715(+)